MRPLRLELALLALVSALVAVVARADDRPAGREHVVRAGETLSHIALHHEVSVDELLRWNPDIDARRLRVGTRLRLETGERRVEHLVERGESLSRIAARYEVGVEDILRWNRRLSRDQVRAGRTLTVFTRVPESRSQSVGRPQSGRLLEGVPLPTRHEAIYVRTPSRAWGTEETVRWLVEAFEAVREAHPETPRIEVHDLSHERGGPMHGHRSHESGRDADVAYYQRRCGRLCSFRRIGPSDLDVERQWTLFHRWLSEEQVEAIFVDHALQAALHAEARRRGATPAELSRWFQYPREPSDRYGIIRHHPRHADHFHVRFVCHESDEDCR